MRVAIGSFWKVNFSCFWSILFSALCTTCMTIWMYCFMFVRNICFDRKIKPLGKAIYQRKYLTRSQKRLLVSFQQKIKTALEHFDNDQNDTNIFHFVLLECHKLTTNWLYLLSAWEYLVFEIAYVNQFSILWCFLFPSFIVYNS